MVSLNTGLKKEELCETTIPYHRDSFHFGLQRNYTPMLHFDFWVSKNPALALTLWQSVGLLRHSQRRRSIPWWTESVAHGFAGTGRMLIDGCSLVFILCVLFASFSWNESPTFALFWIDTMRQYFWQVFNPNLWVLLALKHCGNRLRNSDRLERDREKECTREREKFLKGLANLSNLLTDVVWVPSLQWNLKPGKFLVIWGSAMNILHSSS